MSRNPLHQCDECPTLTPNPETRPGISLCDKCAAIEGFWVIFDTSDYGRGEDDIPTCVYPSYMTAKNRLDRFHNEGWDHMEIRHHRYGAPL